MPGLQKEVHSTKAYWCKLRIKHIYVPHIRTEINILASINLLFNVWLLWNTFELLWKASVLLACEGKHQGSRSDIWIFFKRKAVVSLLSLHPAWHDMGGVCGRSISIYMFLQNFRWWSQNCRWTRHTNCHLCWEMQVHDGPRFMANDNIIFAHDMFFLIRALRTESQITAYHSDIVDTLLRTREPFFRDPWRWLCFNVSLVAWGRIGEAQDSLGGYPEDFQCTVVESITSKSTKISWKCEDDSLCTYLGVWYM